MKILFVEDKNDDVELALLYLQREDIDIDWKRVDCERDLKAALKSWQPDVILSDHAMPTFNGLEALEIARHLAPDVPLIFVSGTIGEQMVFLQNLGCDEGQGYLFSRPLPAAETQGLFSANPGHLHHIFEKAKSSHTGGSKRDGRKNHPAGR